MSIVFFLAVPVILVIWAIAIYNTLVRLRQHIRESWSDIDTELKRRYDLIPNLIETVKGYATHERELLESVTEARTKAMASVGSPAQQAVDENQLIGAMRGLLGVAENYPGLKANANFLQMQKELANTEDRIQAARRFYNGNVRELNSRREMFPSNMIASAFAFQAEEYFEIEDAKMRETPEVKFD